MEYLTVTQFQSLNLLLTRRWMPLLVSAAVLVPLLVRTLQPCFSLAAKVSQLALLPQGKIEAARRAKAMVAKMDELGFGNCTNTGACESECPKSISIEHIARLNREFLLAKLKD